MSTDQTSQEGFVKEVSVDTSLAYMGSLLSFLVSAEDTGGGLTVLVAHSRAGSEPPPHVHQHEHEVYYLLEGEIDFYVEGSDAALSAGPGGVAFLPCGRAHAMIFKGDVRFVTVVHGVAGAKATSEGYLKAMAMGPATSLDLPSNADRYATIDPDVMAKAVKLAADHGMTFLTPEETAVRLPHYPGFRANAEDAT